MRDSDGAQVHGGESGSNQGFHREEASKHFVQDRLKLPWDEFNRVPVAGVANVARLSEMLDAVAVAFMIMTGEFECRARGRAISRKVGFWPGNCAVGGALPGIQ
jgi:hypothetical protein